MGSFTSGLGSQLGLEKEASYGTYKAPSKFMEYTSETMNLNRAFVMSQGLHAGRLFQSGPRRSPTTRSAAGGMVLEVPNKGFGALINMLHGETVTPTKTLTETYTQIHKIGTTDPFAKSLTVQVGKPNTAGTVEPFSYLGSVLTSMELDIALGGFLMANMNWDARDEVITEALATASYPTALESFNFVQCEIKVEGSKLEEARGGKLAISFPKDTGRFYLGNEKKAVPLTNAFMSATLTLTQDYGSNTIYNYFAKGEKKKVEIILTGNKMATDVTKFSLTIVCPEVGFDGDSPNVTGPPVLSQQVPLVVLDNGSEAPMTWTYVSTDVTI